MKNTILNLNTIYTYTNEDLSKKNTIIAMIPNFGYREIILSSSGMKIFKKTRNNKINEMDTRAQTLGLNPNLVHSIDSSIVILLLSKYQDKLNPLVTIHDCYISHPNNMLSLVEILKDEFIEIFEKENLLEKFHQDLLLILDKHKVKYKVEKNKVILLIKDSLDSDLPLIQKYSRTHEEIKSILNKNKNLTRDQLILTPYQKKKFKDLYFTLPPKKGNLNLKEIRNANYII